MFCRLESLLLALILAVISAHPPEIHKTGHFGCYSLETHRCYCTIPKVACEYVGGAMIWTAGCEKANCLCMDQDGHGNECPRPPEFSDEDREHDDDLNQRPLTHQHDERVLGRRSGKSAKKYLHREHAERLKHQHQGTLVLTVSQSENAPFQHGDDASVSEPVASQLVEKTMWARRAQQDQVWERAWRVKENNTNEEEKTEDIGVMEL